MWLRQLCLILLAWCGAFVLSTQLGAGCTSATDTNDNRGDSLSIPHDARQVDSGVGPIAYTARGDGRVWLYDVDDKTVLDTRRIQRGQEYRVIPDENRVTLDDKKVYDQDIKRKHTHRIYFLSSDTDSIGSSDLSHGTVPRNATRVAGGTGELTYRTKDSGHIYVVDEDENRLLYDHRVGDGQEIVITPDDDRIAIDGRNVFRGNLERKHAHRIYFDRE
jgi:DNA-binding beta-propeller fold protein YncE